MVGWPGAAQDRLPADALVIQPGCPGGPRGPGEERRVAGAPARERGAAPERRPDAVRTRRPGLVRRAHPVHPAPALGGGLPGHARDAAGLAPQARRQEIRHQQTAQARPPGDGPEHRPAHHPPGAGEPALGLPAYSRRADQARRLRSRRPPSTRSCAPRASTRRRAGTARPGGSSCTRKPPGSWPPISCTWILSR